MIKSLYCRANLTVPTYSNLKEKRDLSNSLFFGNRYLDNFIKKYLRKLKKEAHKHLNQQMMTLTIQLFISSLHKESINENCAEWATISTLNIQKTQNITHSHKTN